MKSPYSGKVIRQTVEFRASPHDVFEAFVDEQRHAKFTGDAAKISRKVNGTFSVFGGYATGKNLTLVPDKKIVQEWRASDWPEGVSSTITLVLAKTKQGTKVSFVHAGVPPEFFSDIKQGWIEYYWTPLKAYFRDHE